MSLLVVGSVALDDIEAPAGSVKSVLGGAASYCSVASSYFVRTRAVGVEDTVLLETHIHDVLPGDLIVMCSDGLTDMIDEGTVADTIIASPNDLESATRALIEAANDAGGKDNIAVVLARVPGPLTTAPRSWWPPFRR